MLRVSGQQNQTNSEKKERERKKERKKEKRKERKKREEQRRKEYRQPFKATAISAVRRRAAMRTLAFFLSLSFSCLFFLLTYPRALLLLFITSLITSNPPTTSTHCLLPPLHHPLLLPLSPLSAVFSCQRERLQVQGSAHSYHAGSSTAPRRHDRPPGSSRRRRRPRLPPAIDIWSSHRAKLCNLEYDF